MAEKLDEIKKSAAVLFVDSGNGFFSTPTINPNRKTMEKLRGELIAKSYRTMGLDFLTPGERDFALGPKEFFELAKLTGATVVSANLQVPEEFGTLSSYEIWEEGGFKILVTGLTRIENKLPGELIVHSPIVALEKIVDVAKRESVDRLVVLSHLGQSEDKEVGKRFPGLFIIGAVSMDLLEVPILSGESYLFEPGVEGQRLGQIEFTKTAPGFTKPELIEMTEDYDKLNAVRKLMSAYYETLKKISTGVEQGEPTQFVARPGVCKECHEQQFNFWKQTKHSSAILTLYAKNQHYNPSCVECHTLDSDKWLSNPNKRTTENFLKKVFFEDAQAPLDSKKEPERYRKLHQTYWKELESNKQKKELEKNLMGVQCEHCHGNRADHLQGVRGTHQKVKAESCKACHRPPNAPEFELSMFKKIACPSRK
jgi:hypothetical protein